MCAAASSVPSSGKKICQNPTPALEPNQFFPYLKHPYQVPADADLQTFNTATIYRERFHANFGSAALQDS
jgi:hypothetical protein